MNTKIIIKYLILVILCLGWIPLFFIAWDSTCSAINDELTRYVNEKVITPQQGAESMWAIGASLIVMRWFVIWPILVSIVAIYVSGSRWRNKGNKSTWEV